MIAPRPTLISEDILIEQPALALLASLGWGVVNAYTEVPGPSSTLGRETTGEVVLRHVYDNYYGQGASVYN